MSQNTDAQYQRNPAGWKLATPPETEVHVDEEVLTLRAPLVRVHRTNDGAWLFEGPAARGQSWHVTSLGLVVEAWPHVAALSYLESGGAVVWSWSRHGWTSEIDCRCGTCEQPTASDLDHASWPVDLRADQLVSVEDAALTGKVALLDIVATPGGTALLGPGEHRRTSDTMTRVALANVLRRWPHTMQALRSLQEGCGMRWNPDGLNWHEYMLA